MTNIREPPQICPEVNGVIAKYSPQIQPDEDLLSVCPGGLGSWRYVYGFHLMFGVRGVVSSVARRQEVARRKRDVSCLGTEGDV